MEPNPFGDPPLEVQLRCCSEGAEAFVTSFYRDINAGNSLAAYYINYSTLYAAANESADIVINGAKLNASSEYEALLEDQRGGPIPDTTNGGPASRRSGGPKPRARYEVDSFDAQPVNFNFQIALPSVLPQSETAYGGGCITMLVTVMGTLHIDNEPDGDNIRKAFTDVFVLWPNWAARGRGAVARREKNKFLIASQNYRSL